MGLEVAMVSNRDETLKYWFNHLLTLGSIID
jgi:hypothetical protein